MIETRARGCLLGLAAGDALGRPAENLTREEIRRRWGRLTEIEPGKGGTDDTEYTIFAASLLCRYGSALTSADVAREYRQRVVPHAAGPMRGAGFSERGAVQALLRGAEPPMSGLWHQHGWSDGLAMRAAPYGIFAAGDPAEAARLVAADGVVSNSGEGVYGGQAVAAAVAVAMTGAPPAEVVEAGLAAVPEDSWTSRDLRAAVAAAASGSVEDLYAAVVVPHYPWTDLAPEAVALAFAGYLLGAGEVEESVVSAANLGRDADTTAAIAGALAGAGRGEAAVPARWARLIGPADGRCLPDVAGRHVLDVATELAAAARAFSGRTARSGEGREPGSALGPG
ncbi:ADP-ribosylglycohydrolase family protein [Sphaerisporangium album]|uniref:ADP-ribosylglycohydrolase family protein n=1 Tax=Sphaerisporangium album TaxID=509200 RepID=A0A367ER01_9ACTN|nr:ADP-ribosylglycohydrolase family protein [Sphaerisporangium album]RCG20159.1 ADP-ribosylglycohydrolase family protein [Sphaerisporangium album]